MFQLVNGSGFSAVVQVEGNTIIRILATGQNVVLNPGWTILIYTNGRFEQFQSGGTLQTTSVQYIDPVLINEFQELLTRLSFLNALGNQFTPRND